VVAWRYGRAQASGEAGLIGLGAGLRELGWERIIPGGLCIGRKLGRCGLCGEKKGRGGEG
jgi:hypothetical protein